MVLDYIFLIGLGSAAVELFKDCNCHTRDSVSEIGSISCLPGSCEVGW